MLERNPDYWQGPADVSRVTFRFIPEFSARMAALLSGEIDIMKDVPPHAVEAIEKSGRATLRSTVSSRINYLALVNLKPGPMQDLRVRRAMNHAVDVDELIKQVLKGARQPHVRPAGARQRRLRAGRVLQVRPRPCPGALQGGRRSIPRRSADARHAVRPLPARQGRVARHRGPAPACSGIKTNVVVNEWGTHLDKIKNRNTGDMFFLGWGPALYGQGTIQPLFLADQTYSSYGNNKTIDEKIARAQTLLEPKARAEAYADLQKADPRRGAVGLPLAAARSLRRDADHRVDAARRREGLDVRRRR